MSEHPVELSTRMIDSGVVDTPPNRVTQELSELADGVALIESFSHVVVVDTGDGLVAFDSSGATHRRGGGRSRCGAGPTRRSHTLVYTHGHVDHVGGSRAFAADAEAPRSAASAGDRPRTAGRRRFDRYDYTAGYNRVINMRQFGGAGDAPRRPPRRAVPARPARCDPT